MDPMYIILIVKIWNVLNVNRLGDYICVCPIRVALTELETVGNDSCSIAEEEEEEEIPLMRIVLDKTLCDKVCRRLETGQWFSRGTPVSSTNKTDRHDITEILLKVA
jgi:hypothetical protein